MITRLRTTIDLPQKLICILLFVIGAIYVWINSMTAKPGMDDMRYWSPLMRISPTFYVIAGGLILLIRLHLPFGQIRLQNRFRAIGLVNHNGLVPFPARKCRDRDHPKVTIWTFNARSIPLDEWEHKQTAIEAALNATIIKMKYHNGKQQIVLHTVPAKNDLPEKILWQDDDLSKENFVLTLGEGYTGPETVNLCVVPHILLGGATGSGKSVLLKLLLMQAIRKKAVVCIADFKGGVDFPKVWHSKCRMVFDEQSLLTLLTELADELQSRKQLLAESGLPNLDAYNETTGSHLQRYIFACDEIAEVLDKTGLGKEQKELVLQIESKLSLIARQGRAFGIHLILATQRPDAQILSGQIRNNLNCRICGRADMVLSQIILDNTSAADQIPKDARGRFIQQDGTIFQAYWFDDAKL